MTASRNILGREVTAHWFVWMTPCKALITMMTAVICHHCHRCLGFPRERRLESPHFLLRQRGCRRTPQSQLLQRGVAEGELLATGIGKGEIILVDIEELHLPEVAAEIGVSGVGANLPD